MNNKSKVKGMNFSDISNTSNNIDDEASVNLPQNNHIRYPRIYVSYSLCHYYQLLYDRVKEMMQEDPIHNFWILNGGIFKIRESVCLKPFFVPHENDTNLEYWFLFWV